MKSQNLFLFRDIAREVGIPENELIRAKTSGITELDELYPMVLFSARSDMIWIKNSAFIMIAVEKSKFVPFFGILLEKLAYPKMNS